MTDQSVSWRLVAAAATGSLLLAGILAAPAQGDAVTVAAAAGIEGATTGDHLGEMVAMAGDVNGDGFDDMLVGSRAANGNEGAAYLVLGQAHPMDVRVGVPPVLTIRGRSGGDSNGMRVAGLGDVNADGFDDVAVAFPYDNSGRGVSYVVLGSNTPHDVDFDDPGFGFRILGAQDAGHSGASIAGAGDVNRDGYADVVIGAPTVGGAVLTYAGAAYVVYGSATPADVTLLNLGSKGFQMMGEQAGYQAGYAVAGAGDVNRDGYADVVVGAPYASVTALEAGRTYLVLGQATRPDFILTAGVTSVAIDGIAEDDHSGMGVGPAGDLNADGYDDIVIGAPNADGVGKPNSGTATVVLGPPMGTNLKLGNAGSVAFRIDGPSPGNGMGRAVAPSGDVDLDGIDDLLLGAPATTATGEGAAFVVRGTRTPTTVDLGNPAMAIRYDGVAAAEYLGSAVSADADVNGDGGRDLLLGAPGALPSGKAYLVLGAAPAPTPTPTATPAATLTVAARAARRALPRTGRVVVVKKIVVGSGQASKVTARVAPKRTRKHVVVRIGQRVVVRTRQAHKGRLTVRIEATGQGVSPATWVRSWRIR